MRLFFATKLGLVLVCALLLFGARAYAQREAWTPVLPLPDANGCWYGTCFTTVRQADLHTALVQHPLITQIGPQAGPSAYHAVARAGAAALPRGIVIQTSPPESYMLSWDWAVQGNPALMTLGDVIHRYGPPDRVDLEPQLGPTLWYVAHNTALVVAPTRSGTGWLRFAPDDPVTRLEVYDPAVVLDTYEEVARDPWITRHVWHGFGMYVREAD
jgi:hypothetical protein